MNNSALSEIDERIESELGRIFPSESIPYREEVSFIQQKLQDNGRQLRGLGPLSSFTSLDSVKELS